jgi:hypothetical protein
VAPDPPQPLPDAAIEAAITRVLDAETAARADVVCARGEATEIAEHARDWARRIAVHADRRIHRLRAAFAARVSAEVAALEAEADALGAAHVLTPAEIERVEKAVATLARDMTGGLP